MKSVRKKSTLTPLCAVVIPAVLLAFPFARAATKTWNNAAGGDFNTAGNWTVSGVPVAADVGLFNIALSGNVTLSANSIPGSLNFDTNAGGFSLGTLAGSTITTANNGTISVLSTLTGTGKTFTINAPLVLTPASASTAGAYTLQNNATDASNTLVIAGGVTSSTTTNTETLTLGGTNTGANTVSGVIGNGSAATFAVTKSGAGAWLLSGANTYNGATTVSAGLLSLSGAGAVINASSGVAIGGGGTLKLDNTSAANNTDRLKDAGTVTMTGGTLNFSNNGGAVNYAETTGALTIAAGANVITASQAAVGQTSTLTFSSLTRTGGVVDFSGTGLGVNDQNRILFTTNPTLSNGIIGGWATYAGVDFASYDATNGVIQLATHTDINATGSTLADGSTTNVRLNAAGGGGNIALGSVTTTVNTLLQNTTTAATVDTAGKTLRTSAIMIGSGQQALTIGAAAGDGTLTAATAGGSLSLINDSANALTINALIANNSTASSLNTVGNVILNVLPTYTGATSIGSGSLTLTFNSNQAIGAAISGDGALIKEGTGTLTLSTANTFSGGLSINNGSVVYSGNNNTTFGTGAVAFGSGANNTLVTFTGTAATLANNFTINAGAGTRMIVGSSASGGTTISGAVTLNKDLILAQTGGAAGSFTISGVISQTTTAGLVIDATNTGIINLRGNNTFSGGIAINSGTLQGQNAGSVGNVGAVTSGALGTGTVTLGATGNSSSAAIDFPLAYAFANALTVNSGGTRTISASSASQTAASWIGGIALNNDLTLTAVATTLASGANRLNIGNGSAGGGITGSNNIIINNANTAMGAVAGSGAINLGGGSTATAWTGNLIIQAGQGSISSVNAIGTANTVGVASGATFNFSNTSSINPTIAGLSNATSGGALGGSTGGTVTHTQTANRVLTLGGSGNYAFDGVVKNAINGTNTTGLTVALTGTGSQTLSGANSYTGLTTVSSGKLLLNGDNSLATGAVSVASGATFGGSGTVGGATTAASGSFLSAGSATGMAGTLTFAGTLNIAGLAAGTGGLLFDLDTTAASDKIALTSGILSIGTGVLDLNDFSFVALAGYGAGTYTLFSSSTSITGSLGSVLTGSFAGYSTALAISGNDIVLTVSAIPEPATCAAFCGALVLAGSVLRRRRLRMHA